MIAIVDYGVGNLFSLKCSLDYIGLGSKITSDEKELRQADKIILPGVGAFGDAIKKLESTGLIPVIKEEAEKKPLLGICLGMQLLLEKSYEFGEYNGLGFIPGDVVQFDIPKEYKVPHMGWNSVSFPNRGRLFNGINENAFFYFVHSYYLDAQDRSSVTATTEYNTRIDASVESGNVFACQFHPEKSGSVGLTVLKNFISL